MNYYDIYLLSTVKLNVVCLFVRQSRKKHWLYSNISIVIMASEVIWRPLEAIFDQNLQKVMERSGFWGYVMKKNCSLIRFQRLLEVVSRPKHTN